MNQDQNLPGASSGEGNGKSQSAGLHNDPTRTTPMGMTRYAHEFLEAALLVSRSVENRPEFYAVPPVPALYLIGHAIELSLKAYLLSQGETLKAIRSFNHNLCACADRAKYLSLQEHTKFSPQEEGALELLNTLYSTKQFEYIVTGAKQMPMFSLIEAYAVKLFNTVAGLVSYHERVAGCHEELKPK